MLIFWTVTPEKLCTPDFLRLLDIVYRTGELNRLVVDEVYISLKFPSAYTLTFVHEGTLHISNRIWVFRIAFYLTKFRRNGGTISDLNIGAWDFFETASMECQLWHWLLLPLKSKVQHICIYNNTSVHVIQSRKGHHSQLENVWRSPFLCYPPVQSRESFLWGGQCLHGFLST